MPVQATLSTPSRFELPWQPIQATLANFRDEAQSSADLVDSMLAELSSMQDELVAISRANDRYRDQLSERERLLVESRTEQLRLASKFEMQEAKLCEAVGEIRRLHDEFGKRDFIIQSATSGDAGVAEQVHANWQRDCSELFARLDAIAKNQKEQTCSSGALDQLQSQLAQTRSSIEGSIVDALSQWQDQAAQLSARIEVLDKRVQQASPDTSVLTAIREELVAMQSRASGEEKTTLKLLRQERAENLERLQALVSENTAEPPVDPLPEEVAELRKSLLEFQAATKELWQQSQDRLIASIESLAARNSDVGTSSDFDEIRQELSEVHHLLIEMPVATPAVADDGPLVAELRRKLEEAEQRAKKAIDDLYARETDQLVVEMELDRMRSQVAELQRNADQSTASHLEEEHKWRDELRELRETFQTRATPTKQEVAPQTVATKPAAEEADPQDAVTGSLLAQFAKLQKDSARRRTRGNS